MRISPLFTPWAAVVLCSALSWVTPVSAGRIEATRGKTYQLTKKHGPWMIMVTSLTGETAEQYQRAEKAADELVYELRKKGIPAYTIKQDPVIERFNANDRLGRDQRLIYAAQRNMVGILAGNYTGIDDRVGQKTLAYIKAFKPKVLQDAGYTGAPGTSGPLSKAFLTLNPLLSPEEVALTNRDPLLVRLNSGSEYSLYENPGKYTLVVASFYGKSQVKAQRFAEFDLKLKESVTLDSAGLESWQLVKTMRAQNIEAYVYHDRFRSIVTVGAFNSKDDPGITRLGKMFSAKYKQNPINGQDVLVAESIQIPGPDGTTPLKSWTMDPYPQLIDVPAKP